MERWRKEVGRGGGVERRVKGRLGVGLRAWGVEGLGSGCGLSRKNRL